MLKPTSRTARVVLPALATLTVLSGSAPALATTREPTVHPSSTTAPGIIMRDGGICDPIRHMGC
jgi:hypothetical protein